jgi:hypothetical protein
MATDPRALDTGHMDSILIYCRPHGDRRGHALRAWLEHQAAELSARPGVERTAVVHLTTPDPNALRDIGWLVECELSSAGTARADTLRELLTDMRLVGLEPVVFTREPQSDDAQASPAA